MSGEDEGRVALVTGAGTHSGFAPALVEQLSTAGYRVAAVSRREETLSVLRASVAESTELVARAVDLTREAEVDALVGELEATLGPIEVLVHTAAQFQPGGILETSLETFESLWRANVATAIPAAGAVGRRMVERGRGTMIFSGATASVRGGGRFAAFASAKFALRGLVQAMARDLGPKGVHVVHVIIDGVVWGRRAEESFGYAREACIEPSALAKTVLSLIEQHESAWTHELDVRPAKEKW